MMNSTNLFTDDFNNLPSFINVFKYKETAIRDSYFDRLINLGNFNRISKNTYENSSFVLCREVELTANYRNDIIFYNKKTQEIEISEFKTPISCPIILNEGRVQETPGLIEAVVQTITYIANPYLDELVEYKPLKKFPAKSRYSSTFRIHNGQGIIVFTLPQQCMDEIKHLKYTDATLAMRWAETKPSDMKFKISTLTAILYDRFVKKYHIIENGVYVPDTITYNN